MIEYLQKLSNRHLVVIYVPERIGDVRHSKASLMKFNTFLGYQPEFDFDRGIGIVFDWYKTHNVDN
jgi:UDP-N-acetylglucosamine 4-epimerase